MINCLRAEISCSAFRPYLQVHLPKKTTIRLQPLHPECYRCVKNFKESSTDFIWCQFLQIFVTAFKLQLGLVLGLMLAAILGVGLQYGARLFTKDVNVLHLIGIGIPVSPLSRSRTQCSTYTSSILNGISIWTNSLQSKISLLQLLSPSMPWHLFSTVSTLEHLISRTQLFPWQVFSPFLVIQVIMWAN